MKRVIFFLNLTLAIFSMNSCRKEEIPGPVGEEWGDSTSLVYQGKSYSVRSSIHIVNVPPKRLLHRMVFHMNCPRGGRSLQDRESEYRFPSSRLSRTRAVITEGADDKVRQGSQKDGQVVD